METTTEQSLSAIPTSYELEGRKGVNVEELNNEAFRKKENSQINVSFSLKIYRKILSLTNWSQINISSHLPSKERRCLR